MNLFLLVPIFTLSFAIFSAEFEPDTKVRCESPDSQTDLKFLVEFFGELETAITGADKLSEFGWEPSAMLQDITKEQFALMNGVKIDLIQFIDQFESTFPKYHITPNKLNRAKTILQ